MKLGAVFFSLNALAIKLSDGLLEVNDPCMKSPLPRHRCNPGWSCQIYNKPLMRGLCKAMNGTRCNEQSDCLKGHDCIEWKCFKAAVVANSTKQELPDFE